MESTEYEELSEKSIRKALPERLSAAPIYIFETTDSTNIRAKSLARSGAEDGTLVLAEKQTAGRGRRGKSFFSPKGGGLYMSLVLRPGEGGCDIQLLTIAAATAVCLSLEKLAGIKPQIKWVNDIYLDEKKLCGILCEKNSDTDAVIVGIGINLAGEVFPQELEGIACALNAPVSRNELAAAVKSAIYEVLSMDIGDVLNVYRRHSLMSGRRVRFELDGQSVLATAEGIADNGNLQVRLDNGEEMSLSSGEVSVKTQGRWQ